MFAFFVQAVLVMVVSAVLTWAAYMVPGAHGRVEFQG